MQIASSRRNPGSTPGDDDLISCARSPGEVASIFSRSCAYSARDAASSANIRATSLTAPGPIPANQSRPAASYGAGEARLAAAATRSGSKAAQASSGGPPPDRPPTAPPPRPGASYGAGEARPAAAATRSGSKAAQASSGGPPPDRPHMASRPMPSAAQI